MAFNKKTILVILFFLITAVLLHWGHLLKSDEGVVLNAAWKLYHGQRLYVDFFEYVGPGSFYFVLGIFKLFGPSYEAVKVISVAAMLGATFLLYCIFMDLSHHKALGVIVAYTWFVTASTFYPLINHNTYSTLLVIVLVYAFFSSRPFLLGLSSATTLYFLQTKGALMIILTSFFLLFFVVTHTPERHGRKSMDEWLKIIGVRCGVSPSFKQKNGKPGRKPMEGFTKKFSRKALLSYAAGLAIIFIMGFWLWGIDVFTAPFAVSSAYMAVNTISYLPLFVSVIITGMVFLLLKMKHLIHPKTSYLIATQIVLIASVLNRPDIFHLLLNSFPLIILMVFLARHTVFDDSRARLETYIQGLVIVVLFLTIMSRFFTHYEFTQKTRLFLANVRQRVGDEEIFSHPFMPGLYFELRKRNPYPTSVVETIQGSEEFLKKNFLTLRRENPQYVITNYEIVKIFGYRNNEIDEYIEKNYKLIHWYQNGSSLWRRI